MMRQVKWLGVLLLLSACGELGTDSEDGSENTALGGTDTSSKESITVEGDISAIDPETGVIQIMGMDPGVVITINAATELRDQRGDLEVLTLADLAVGDHVKIRVTVDGETAVVLRLELQEARDRAKLEGPAEAIDAEEMTLEIFGILVVTDENTDFLDADGFLMTAEEFFAALQEGDEVEAEGTVQEDGSLLAEELQLEPDSGSSDDSDSDSGSDGDSDSGSDDDADSSDLTGEPFQIEADLVSIDVDSGTVQLLSLTVVMADTTEFRDPFGEVSPLTLANLAEGDHVRIQVRLNGEDLVARRLERQQPRERVLLEGEVEAVDPEALTFEILGILIVTDANTDFLDADGFEITAEEFFAALADDGAEAEAEGTLQEDGSILAEEAQLQPED